MLPNDNGRYCNSCAKTVIDFSVMTDEQVQQYIIQHQQEHMCGRFKKTQLHRIVIDLPANILYVRMPLWKKFLVACMIIFAASIFPFETTIAGNAPTGTSFYQGEPIKVNNDKKPRKTKKKKHRKYAYNKLQADDIWLVEGTIAGGFGIFDPPVDYSEMLHPRKQTDIQTQSDQNIKTKLPGPEKKEPVSIPPFYTEFILPAIFVKRKKKDNNTMD